MKNREHPTMADGRRDFMKWSMAAAAAAIAFGVDVPALRLDQAFAQAAPVDVGGGDIGILNYAYALEQLEAAFYTQVIASPYRGLRGQERAYLTDIRNHEVAHRELFRRAIGANRIPDLTPNFSAVDFSSRDSVLRTASTFEDLGVAAYNGGGASLQSPQFLALAGQIVSVEARHAAILRDLISPLSEAFAAPDVVDASGLDRALAPGQVLQTAAPFIATPVTAFQLPSFLQSF